MQAVRGLGDEQSRVLGAEQEAIEEAARQDDVVVDDEQPVIARRGVLGEQVVEVLEAAARGVAHLDGVHRDLVARAVKLRAGAVHEAAGALHAEHEDAAARRALARGAVEAAVADRGLGVEQRVGGAAQRSARAAHGAAAA